MKPYFHFWNEFQIQELSHDWNLYSEGLHFPSFLFLLPLSQLFLSQESHTSKQGVHYMRSVCKRTQSYKNQIWQASLSPTFFLWFLKLIEEHKARSFNLRFHHKPLINHLNNPLFSRCLKVAEFLFKVYPKVSTFYFFLQNYHQPIQQTTGWLWKSDYQRLSQSYTSKTASHDFPLENTYVNIDRESKRQRQPLLTIWRKRNDRVWLARLNTDLKAQHSNAWCIYSTRGTVTSRQDPQVQEMQY